MFLIVLCCFCHVKNVFYVFISKFKIHVLMFLIVLCCFVIKKHVKHVIQNVMHFQRPIKVAIFSEL